MNGVSFFGIISNGLTPSATTCGFHANRVRGVNGVMFMGNTGRRSTPTVVTNSVNIIAGVTNIGANSALYSPGGVLGLTKISFPGPYLSVTIGISGGNRRRGITTNLAELVRRSPAVAFTLGGRAERRILSNLNRRRLSMVISGLGGGFNMSMALRLPGITCHRAVEGPMRTRNGRGGRSNNRNRFNSI